MKGKWAIIGTLGGLAVVAVVLLIVFTDPPEKKSNREKDQPVNWDISYEHDDRSPYGTFLFYELLKKKYAGEGKKMKMIQEDFEEELNDTANRQPEIYFIIANSMNLDYDERESLKSFVEDGNYAFISLQDYPDAFEYIIENTHFIETSTMERTRINFYPESLRDRKKYFDFYYFFEGKKYSYPWKSFKRRNYSRDQFEDTEAPEEEYIEEDTSVSDEYYEEETSYWEPEDLYTSFEYNNDSNDVFIRVPWGSGYFYFHSVPVSFTNIALLNERNVEHMERVLACLPDAQPVWDQYGQMEYLKYREQFSGGAGSGTGSGDKPRTSPLQFILSKPSLKWAYYTLLATLLFYILFQVKRKQKVIPAVAKNENSSLDFIDTVSKLYFQQYRHKNLLRHKYRILLNFIRERYFITTSKPDQPFIALLARKSQVEEDRISRLFASFESIEKSSAVSDEMLITIHQQVEYFYKNCK
ncbi:MAG: DUF4350 domain-containing protein [Bacteroidota bacterium]